MSPSRSTLDRWRPTSVEGNTQISGEEDITQLLGRTLPDDIYSIEADEGVRLERRHSINVWELGWLIDNAWLTPC